MNNCVTGKDLDAVDKPCLFSQFIICYSSELLAIRAPFETCHILKYQKIIKEVNSKTIRK